METFVAEEIRDNATDVLRVYEWKRKKLLEKIAQFKSMATLTEKTKEEWDSTDLSLMIISYKAEAVFNAFMDLGIFTMEEAITVIDDARREFGLSEDGKQLVETEEE